MLLLLHERGSSPPTLERVAGSGGSAGHPSSGSHVVPTAARSAFLASSSGHRARFQEAQMDPASNRAPEAPPAPEAPQPQSCKSISHGTLKDPHSFREVGDWTLALNRKVNEESVGTFH